MKFMVVFAALAVTVSASRCKFIRFTPAVPGNCGSGHKSGDQTDEDGCSDTHTNSCYFMPSGQTGDPACRLVVTPGGGCNVASGILASIRCNQTDVAAYVSPEHSYIVTCD
ncbi:hypothetical protein F5Y07DRAFT_313481 [Xylaria sp. FL0933]|nr:hypothetical protein F5Y07DRAFT_313481 [Xylaria sp. FL0933]